jgi:hypothetical protein
MRYVYAGPESPGDRRHEYRVAVLRAALERTREGHGEYTLEATAQPMLLRRQVEEVRRAGGLLTVLCRSVSVEMERELWPVRIPVDRGLTGYRVLLIREGDRARFEAARTLDDLRQFVYGVEEWIFEDDILKANGFRVMTGSDYEGLFQMLANGRFEAFPRPAGSVRAEYESRRKGMPGVVIERSLVLHYPMPLYFWFAKTAEGERLAARVTEGMKGMVEDGSLERMFFAHFGREIRELELERRRVFRIDNPLLKRAAPLDDGKLWFDPARDRVPAEGEGGEGGK